MSPHCLAYPLYSPPPPLVRDTLLLLLLLLLWCYSLKRAALAGIAGKASEGVDGSLSLW